MMVLGKPFPISREGIVFALFIIVFSAVFLSLISAIPYIGIGDSPIYANIAENLFTSGEYNVDYVMTFFNQYREISHAEDNWFPLPVFTIALSYSVLGVSLFSAQFTNYWILVLLMLVMYFAGSRLVGKKASLLSLAVFFSGLLVWVNTLVPMSEAAFGLAATVMLVSLLLYRETGRMRWLLLLLVSAFLTGMARQSAIAFVPIAFLWVVYAYHSRAPKPSLSGVHGFSALPSASLHDILNRNRAAITLAVLLSLVVLAGYMVQPAITFLNHGSLTHQPAKNAIIKLSTISKGNYEDIFSIHYGEDFREEVWTPDNIVKVIGFSALETGRFLRDLLTQDIFPTILVLFFFASLFSGKSGTREVSRLTLISILVFAFFVLFFGHYEQRYFIIFAPLMSLAAASAVFEFSEKLRAGFERNLYFSIAALFLIITFLGTASLVSKDDSFFPKQGGVTETNLKSFGWIRENTPENAAVFSRHPATIGYHSNRKSVMIPNNSMEQILLIADYYGVDYFWFSNSGFARFNPRFEGIMDGNHPEFLELVYDSHPSDGRGQRERVRIYRIEWEKTGFEEIEKPEWFFARGQ